VSATVLPKAVAFDLDGTLIDSESLVRGAYAEAGARFGVTVDAALFRSLVGRNLEANRVILRERFGDDFPVDTFRAAASAVIGDRAAPLKPGARELLDHLAANRIPCGLCTASSRLWVVRHFAAHGLVGRFVAVVTRDDVVHGKPHPEPYLKVAAALGHAPADVLAIEDSATGLEAAFLAGTRAVLVPDLLEPTAACRERAAWIAGSLHEVLDWLRPSSRA
jgi:HAD superfamily hydrolase (TIGR01509 family)